MAHSLESGGRSDDCGSAKAPSLTTQMRTTLPLNSIAERCGNSSVDPPTRTADAFVRKIPRALHCACIHNVCGGGAECTRVSCSQHCSVVQRRAHSSCYRRRLCHCKRARAFVLIRRAELAQSEAFCARTNNALQTLPSRTSTYDAFIRSTRTTRTTPTIAYDISSLPHIHTSSRIFTHTSRTRSIVEFLQATLR